MFRRSRNDRCGGETDEVRQAREAAERAVDERRRVEAQAEEAELIGSTIRNALKRNHFGEAIERSWALRRGVT